ncbi:MAG: GntR family transcriptional regulator [Actinomycetota bacterium]|nr:GntR family transcriptional regulator [Actinomycetota bacterium]
MDTEVDRRGGIPLYIQLMDRIRELIDRQGLVPGTLLPSEAQLQERFGVSRATVRQALHQLELDGLVERHQGRGTFVAASPGRALLGAGELSHQLSRPPRPPEAPGEKKAPGDGLLLFARYAYAPNERGYCGPADHRALLEYGSAGEVDPGLKQLALAFAGPWPYLQLIAGANGIGDPFDGRVVEAYWLGNQLLERIDMSVFGNALRDRFRRRSGRSWAHLAEAVPAGASPHHGFHVFEVYPWVGLLSSDRGEPLEILDRCRIRWGQVVTTRGEQVVVRFRPLTWDGKELRLGSPQRETARRALDGMGFTDDLRPGEWVALHWEWVCDRLSRRQLANLRHYTLRQLDITNRKIGHPGPAAVLG